MIFSSQTEFLAPRYGLERAVDMLIEAGYPAIDISMFDINACPFTDDYREIAERIKERAYAHGVKFIQAHAPFKGGYDNYINNLIPNFPRAFEFCSILGIENIVVHPIMKGHYYGVEQEHFEMNMKFYSALAPLAKTNHVKIAQLYDKIFNATDDDKINYKDTNTNLHCFALKPPKGETNNVKFNHNSNNSKK